MSRSAHTALAAIALLLVALSPLRSAGAQNGAAALRDIPITEVPSATGQTLAIFWSGDGGWAALPSTIAKELAANGIAVVGVNSRTWLERGTRTPDAVAHDTERLLRSYLARWSRAHILLLGYSRGADFLPFIYNRLPADLRERVQLVGMLGAAKNASFEFHLIDLIRDSSRPTDIPVLAEIQRSVGSHFLCMYGTDETNTLCTQLDRARMTVIARNGDHHFDRNYPEIARDIIAAIPAR